MPFRHVAFFIKCRARGCGICSWAAGGHNCSVRNAWILSTASFKKGARDFGSRQKWSKKPEFCLPLPPKRVRATIEVDKNRVKYLDFVYRILQNRATSSAVNWEVLPKSACTRPIFTAPYPNAASHHRCIQKHWILQKKNRRKSDGS